ncbi:Lymphocyte antigen 96 [Struthio camelus australis]|uniref:Lymphocyte antigen 96 n=1 Tax=Struthio camelus australis TaxID=441894 RepID=A0A093ICQ7_STRCA|nr:PREDICTED: lymphocyte antigen 96 isoform X1 [Struthio camelus australis]KFV88887.1 Lymphocyte antigen 96 [Struthio camelus australis]
MFQLFFFVLFTPGLSKLLCTSSDLEISYTFCDSVVQTFIFNITPCTMVNKPIWNVALTWIPRNDITFLKVVFKVLYDGAKALDWKEVLCSGADDEYAVCGTLKGETVATTFDIKGARTTFPQGKYTIIIHGFADDSEKNMLVCLNFTMTVKQEAL